MGLPDGGERLVRGGAVVRDALERRFLEIASRTEAELHEAARKAWEGAYGVGLAKVQTRDVARNRVWRH
jgi:hypothetical protein